MSQLGCVAKASISRLPDHSPGYGFVTFTDIADVAKVLDVECHAIRNVPVTVERVDSPEAMSLKRSEIQKRKVFVKSLSKKASDRDLRMYFEAFGELESVCLNRCFNGKSKRTAFIVFKQPSDAKALLQNEAMKHTILNKKVKIYQALSKKDISEYIKKTKGDLLESQVIHEKNTISDVLMKNNTDPRESLRDERLENDLIVSREVSLRRICISKTSVKSKVNIIPNKKVSPISSIQKHNASNGTIYTRQSINQNPTYQAIQATENSSFAGAYTPQRAHIHDSLAPCISDARDN